MQLPPLNFTSIAGLTAIGAIAATTWRYISQFGRYLVGLVIGSSVFKDDAGAAVLAFTFQNSLRSPLGMRIFGGYESYVHPKRWIESVGYEGITSDPVIIKYNGHYALVSLLGNSNKDRDVNIGGYGDKVNLIKIRYFRWFFDVEKFAIEAIEAYNIQKRQGLTDEDKTKVKRNNRFKIVRYSGHSVKGGGYGSESDGGKTSPAAPPGSMHNSSGEEEMIMKGIFRLLKWQKQDLLLRPEEGTTPFTGFPFPKEVESAIKELELWLSHEKWFRSKSIPWRRGWLLHGEPGTGKSTLVRALAMAFDMPLYVFDLAGMTNDDLSKTWEDMMTNTPCLVLIEDIDNIFEGRKYVGSTNPNIPHVTFDCLLNCISGVKQANGVFLVITTNHIEKLDPAIGIPDKTGKSSRPGRIDKALYLGKMGEELRRELAKHILSDFPDLIDVTVADGHDETAAQFQSRCAQIALGKFWEQGKKLAKDEPTYVTVGHFDRVDERPNAVYQKQKMSTTYGVLGYKER